MPWKKIVCKSSCKSYPNNVNIWPSFKGALAAYTNTEREMKRGIYCKSNRAVLIDMAVAARGNMSLRKTVHICGISQALKRSSCLFYQQLA